MSNLSETKTNKQTGVKKDNQNENKLNKNKKTKQTEKNIRSKTEMLCMLPNVPSYLSNVLARIRKQNQTQAKTQAKQTNKNKQTNRQTNKQKYLISQFCGYITARHI